jgi:hypothetical protein
VENGGSNRISEVWDCHVSVLSLCCCDPLRQAALSDCSAEINDGGLGVGGLDAVGLSWTPWDMIQKMCRADQAFRIITDAGRTERGFHAVGNGECEGQRLFRWMGMGGL